MKEIKITLEEWGEKIFNGVYKVLGFDYKHGKTTILNTEDNQTYIVTYNGTLLTLREKNGKG
jgi:hypothetical protein